MTITKTNNSLYPVFVFTGDVAVAEQIQAYCQRWFITSSANSTYINVIYLADVMPVYAVPNARVYKVTRTETGFELSLMVDLVDSLVGNVSQVEAFWPTVYDEAYWWDWIDDISADDPAIIYTTLNPLTVGTPGNIPILTPNGFEPTPYNDVIPSGVNPGGGIGQLPYNWYLGGDGWSFAGISNYAYQWSCENTEFWYVDFPGLVVETDSGTFRGLSVVNGGKDFGRIRSAEMYFNAERSGTPAFCGGAQATIVIKTAYERTNETPSQGQWYLHDPVTLGTYIPATYDLSALSNSYDFATFSIQSSRLLSPHSYSSYYDRRTVGSLILDSIELPASQPPSFQFQEINFHFERCSKGLCELLPFLPPFVPPVEIIPPVTGFIPPFIGGLLGGMMTQTTQAIFNLLLLGTVPGRKDSIYGKH